MAGRRVDAKECGGAAVLWHGRPEEELNVRSGGSRSM
jgi:hypothetical protein